MKNFNFLVLILFFSVSLLSCHTCKKATEKPQVSYSTLSPDNAIIIGQVTGFEKDSTHVLLLVKEIKQRGSSFHAPVRPGQTILLLSPSNTLSLGKQYSLEIQALEQLGGKYKYTLVKNIKH